MRTIRIGVVFDPLQRLFPTADPRCYHAAAAFAKALVTPRLEDLLPFGAGFFVEHREFSHFREANPVLICGGGASAERRLPGHCESPPDILRRAGFRSVPYLEQSSFFV
jgi:hypothetical protein